MISTFFHWPRDFVKSLKAKKKKKKKKNQKKKKKKPF